jgi:fatty acid desaturase
MHYHTEHHMYAAVPCYRLATLHALVRDDLPPTPHGLYATWKQISTILLQQRQNPAFQYVQELPLRAQR